MRTVEIAAASCHVELTNLVIPGYNDTDEDFRILVDWVHSVNPSMPLHFSRYYPRHKFNAPETPKKPCSGRITPPERSCDTSTWGTCPIPASRTRCARPAETCSSPARITRSECRGPGQVLFRCARRSR